MLEALEGIAPIYCVTGNHEYLEMERGRGAYERLIEAIDRTENTYLYVSRGVGNHGFPLRLNNPPHLPLLILKKGESGV